MKEETILMLAGLGVAGYLVYQSNILSSVGSAFESVGSGIGTGVQAISETAEGVGEGVSGFAQEAFPPFGYGIGQAGAGVGYGVGQAGAGIGSGLGEGGYNFLLELLTRLGIGAGKAAEGAGEGAGEAARGAGEGAGKVFRSAGDVAESSAGLYNELTGFAGSPFAYMEGIIERDAWINEQLTDERLDLLEQRARYNKDLEAIRQIESLKRTRAIEEAKTKYVKAMARLPSDAYAFLSKKYREWQINKNPNRRRIITNQINSYLDRMVQSIRGEYGFKKRKKSKRISFYTPFRKEKDKEVVKKSRPTFRLLKPTTNKWQNKTYSLNWRSITGIVA